MRIETTEKKVYSVQDVLENPKLKEKVLEKMHDINTSHDWYDFIYYDAKEIGKILGFDIENIYFSGFSSQGDGACFDCSFSYNKDCIKKLRSYATLDEKLHQIIKDLVKIYSKSFYTLRGTTKHTGQYTHQYSMTINCEVEKGNCDCNELKEVIADFARWIYMRLWEYYDYLTSDAGIIETIEANDYEFDENGNIY